MKLLGNHIMIDVETMGGGTAPPLLSLGAVAFNYGKGVFDKYHRHIDLQSCIDEGLIPAASTILWWLEQSDVARQKIIQGQENAELLPKAIKDFFEWIDEVYEGLAEDCFVWSFGSNADIRWLDEICEKLNLTTPWSYRNIGCYRTLCRVFPMIPYKHTGVKHDALADAESQANHLIEMFKYDECVSKGAYESAFTAYAKEVDDQFDRPDPKVEEEVISVGIGPSSLKG